MNSKELGDLIISWLTLSAAFALVLSRGFLNIFSLIVAFPIAAIGVGTGFVFHELAHRQVARHFGAHAEFRAWKTGLLFAILLPLITFGRFLFAAPGAVYIYGPHLSIRENGIISVSGAVVNILVAISFFGLSLLLVPNSLAWIIAIWGLKINFFLAWFNLLPLFVLDGAKVFAWNKTVWAVAFVIATIGAFIL